MTSTKKATTALYWVTTRDHDEDWFILARNSRSASTYHESSEGYNPGDAVVRKVLGGVQLTDGASLPRHAQIEDLESLGFRLLQSHPYRIVRFHGKIYKEGQMQALVDTIHEVLIRDQNGAEQENSADDESSAG